MFNNPEHLEAFFTQKRLSTFFNEITLQEDNVEFADVSFSENPAVKVALPVRLIWPV